MRPLATFAALLVWLLMVGVLPMRGQSHQWPNASFRDWEYTPPSASKSVEIGNFYLHKKDYRGALSRFEEALRTEPGYAPAYLGLGEVYDRTGRKEEALGDYLKYLNSLVSDSAAAHAKDAQRAIARLKRELTPGQVKSAEAEAAAAERAIAIRP